jgi:hypothetical protein
VIHRSRRFFILAAEMRQQFADEGARHDALVS